MSNTVGVNEQASKLPPTFHDIKLQISPLEMVVLTIFGIIGVIALVAGTIIAMIWQNDYWEDRLTANIASFLALVVCAASIMLLISVAFFWSISRVVHDLKNANIASSTMLQRVTFIFGAYPSVKIAQLAARRGVHGLTIRTWRNNQPPAIVPIDVNFEPKPLDESEAVFQDLREGVVTGIPGTQRTSGLLKRNIVLSGGWPAVLGIGISLMFAVFGGFMVSRGSILAFVKFVGLFILIFTLRFLRFGPIQSSRFIVPGGLLCRSVIKRKRGGTRIYARSDSNLWIAKMTPQIWSIVVARGNKSERFRATGIEADMLLRAWLSPLEPPQLEKLKDFE